MDQFDKTLIPDVFSEEFLMNPFPWYTIMRKSAPVFYDEINHYWSIFRYPEVQQVLSDHERFSSQSRREVVPSEDQPFASSILGMDPPRHNQLRALVSQAFTPRAVEALTSRIAAIVAGLLDQFEPGATVHLVKDFANPLPVIVIAEMLGIPAEDRERFKVWSDIVVSLSDGGNSESIRAQQGAIQEMREYFVDILQKRSQEPGDDLISGLLRAEVGGQHLNLIELFGFGALLLVAGNVTTTNLISSAILCFSDHPEAWDRLKSDPARVPQAVEEVLRYRPPVRSIIRVTKAEAEVGGRKIPPGSAVISWIGSANRDETQFPDPDRFDIDRSPNRHLSFGQGIHYCLGAPLARLEARLALTAMLERYRSVELASPAAIQPYPSFILYGVQELPVVFGSA